MPVLASLILQFYGHTFFFRLLSIKKQFSVARTFAEKKTWRYLLLWPGCDGNWNISLNDAIKQIILRAFLSLLTLHTILSNSSQLYVWKIYRFEFKSRTKLGDSFFPFSTLGGVKNVLWSAPQTVGRKRFDDISIAFCHLIFKAKQFAISFESRTKATVDRAKWM